MGQNVSYDFSSGYHPALMKVVYSMDFLGRKATMFMMYKYTCSL